MIDSPFHVDSLTSRFLTGGVAEAESLLGTPLPTLPSPEMDGEKPVYYVCFSPELQRLAQRTVQGFLYQIGLAPEGSPNWEAEFSKDQAEYQASLAQALRAAYLADRRSGIVNLFWLAHTRFIAQTLRELQTSRLEVRILKYSLEPLLSSFYRHIDQTVRRQIEQTDTERQAFLAGHQRNPNLVSSLLEDGFAFTERSILDFDFNLFLAANKRYRIPADVFFEIFSILIRETEKRLREGDRLMLSRVTRYMPGIPKDQYMSQSGITKIMMNDHVLTFLFADVWSTGGKLKDSVRLSAEVTRRRASELIDGFLELIRGVKLFELLSNVRERIVLLRRDRDWDESARAGRRIYEFGESTQVLNNAVNTTVLFLDLRGFTRMSELQISERDLTQELYTVFDAFVPIIRRFGGTVDKYIGDGMMVTFGTTHENPLDPLNALRVAILCQETLRRMRQEGRSEYKMGVAIHFGRANLARFIASEEDVQETVIGRNVNIAGRLSSASRRAASDNEDEEMHVDQFARPSGLLVMVDHGGTLINEGIVISRDTLAQIESHLPLTYSDASDGRRMEYFDESIGRRMVIRYAGDAKFKGVRSSFPVFEVDYEM
jgi:class 3 adenylate cyclase